MSDLYNFVKKELDNRKRPLKWLADEIGMSRQGLKSALESKSVKMNILLDIADTLKVPVLDLLYTDSNISKAQNSIIDRESSEKFKEENKLLKKRISELEDQLRDKNMIVSLMTEKKDFMTNLVFYYIDTFLNNIDKIDKIDSLKADLEKAPIDYLDRKKVWEYINKRIKEKKKIE